MYEEDENEKKEEKPAEEPVKSDDKPAEDPKPAEGEEKKDDSSKEEETKDEEPEGEDPKDDKGSEPEIDPKMKERAEIKFKIWKDGGELADWITDKDGYQKIEYVYKDKEKTQLDKIEKQKSWNFYKTWRPKL